MNKGFTEVRGKLDARAAGQERIVNLLNALISQHGGSSDERWPSPRDCRGRSGVRKVACLLARLMANLGNRARTDL